MSEEPSQTVENAAPVHRPAPSQGKSKEKDNSKESGNIDLLMDVYLKVTVELGRARMSLRQVLDLQNGSVIELDRLAGDVVDVFVNDRLIARGEVVVVDDKFGVRITEVVSHENGKSAA